jgi:uncharacterized protein
MLRFVIFILAIFASSHVAWAETVRHVLKGRIVRSLTIDSNERTHVLVGQKAKAAGSALVFRSLDGGKNWRSLNGNKSLHPKATDVQAVLAVSKKVLLAGTWKHGLYVSRNSGQSFEQVKPFPSSDIRDLQMLDGVLFAATARHGVHASTDTGRSWKPLGPGDDFLWSLTVASNNLFASSPEKAVYEGTLFGAPWRKIFSADGANAIAITPGSGGLRAVAGSKGLHITTVKGWRTVLRGENFADVLITRHNRILAGSWDKGVAVLTSGGQLEKRLLTEQSVIHLQVANRQLYAGTWGDGLHILPMAKILSRPGGDTLLITAVLRDDLDAVKQLIAAGEKVDGVDTNRNTALIFAARDGQTDIARALLDAGAEPGWIDGEKVTPLILASFKNHPEIVKLLRDKGSAARPNHADKSGLTALDYARQRGTDDAIYKLLSR